MLTLSKVVVEVCNHADAARAGDYRLELEAAPGAFARTEYQLAAEGLEPVSQRSSSLWFGSDLALEQFGVRRGQAIERGDLIAVLQGQHVRTGEQLRRPGALRREARDEHGRSSLDEDGRPIVERVRGVVHVEMTLSVPKSVSVLWAMADERDRGAIEDALLVAAERTVQYMAKNKAVVHRRNRDGGRVREAAAGAAVASSLHVTARRARGDRAPAPQLHVHNLVVGVVRNDGRVVAADSWEWFRHDAALEGGALFRAQVADALVKAGWAVRSSTGDRGRYFEVEGVPEALCEVFSPRSREVADARAELERELGIRLQGGALAVLAKETRRAKDRDPDPERLRQVWDALGQEHGFGPGASGRLRKPDSQIGHVETRMLKRGRWCWRACASRVRRSVSRALARWCSRPRRAGCRRMTRSGCWPGWRPATAASCSRSPALGSPRVRSASSNVTSWMSRLGPRRTGTPRRWWVTRRGRPGWRPRRRRWARASLWIGSSWRRSSCSPAPAGGRA